MQLITKTFAIILSLLFITSSAYAGWEFGFSKTGIDYKAKIKYLGSIRNKSIYNPVKISRYKRSGKKAIQVCK